MSNNKILWKTRFKNFERGILSIEKGIKIKKLNEFERLGLIKIFEFTFELSWKTLKDYLESQNVDVKFPRDVIKKAFHYELIEDGELWLEMLNNRNLLSHTYSEKQAEFVYKKIKEPYSQAVSQVYNSLKEKLNNS